MRSIKKFINYALLGLALAMLVYCIYWMGLPGLVVWVIGIGAPWLFFGKRKEPTEAQKRARTTGVVLPRGGVLWNRKIISLEKAQHMGLRLEYPERPRRKRHFWKSWS